MSGTGSNNTKRKRADKERAFKNVILSTQQETSLDSILVFDDKGKIISYNRHFIELWGIPEDVVATGPDKLALKSVLEKLTDPEAFLARVDYLDAHKYEKSHEEILLKDGRVLDRYSAPMVGKKGKYYGRVWYFRDITEHKRAEEALRESEAKFRSVIENIPDVTWTTDQDGRTVFISSKVETVYGFTPEEIYREGDTIWLGRIHPDDVKNVKEKFQALFERHELFNIEYRIQRKDQNWIWLHDRAVATYEKDGIWYTDGIFADITEHKLTEEALRESEERYRTLAEASPDQIFIIGRDDTMKYVNAASLKLFRLPYDQVIGKSRKSLFPPEIADAQSSHLKKIFETGERVRTEAIIQFGKQEFWLDTSWVPLTDNTGNVIAILGVARDITERKRAEQSIRESELRYRSLFEGAAEGILVADIDTKKFLYANPAMCRMLGYSEEELTTLGIEDIHPKESLDYVTGEFMAQARGEKLMSTDIPLLRKDKTILNADISTTHIFIDGGMRNVGFFSDITERKRAEAVLKASEHKYRTLVENIPEKIFVKDALLAYVSCNAPYARDLGIAAEAIAGKTDFDFYPRDLAEKYRADDRAVMASGVSSTIDERYVLNGVEFWVSTLKTPVRDNAGNISGILGIFHDITEQKRAEEAIRESEERYRTLTEASPDQIFIVGRDDTMKFVNTAALKMFHRSYDQVIGLPRKDLFPPAIADAQDILLKKVFETGEHIQTEEKIQFGTQEFWIDTNLVPLKDNTGNVIAVLGVARDITARKQVEEERERIRSWRAGVNRIFESVLVPAPRDQKLKIITDGVVEIFGADFCRIWIIEKGDLCNTDCMHAGVTEGPYICRFRDQCLHLKASSGRYTHIDGKGHRRVPFGAYKIGRIASGEETKFLTNDVEHDPRVHDHAWAKSLGLVSFLGYRLKAPNSEVLGVFALFARFPISPDMDAILEGLSRAISLVIQIDIADKALRESELRYRTLIDSAAEGILVIDSETHKIRHANPAICRMLGYSEEELTTLGMEHTIPKESMDYVMGEFMAQIRGGKTLSMNVPLLRKDKTIQYTDVKSARVLIDEKMSIVGFFTDITERKKSEDLLKQFNKELEQKVKARTEELNASLDEKILLLREVHHRVNNNLQIIISLANLQMRHTDDPEIKQILSEMQNRMRAISLVYEKLYRTEDLSRIDFADYTRFLTTQLFSVYGMDTRRVRQDFALSKTMVDITTAVPLGLVMNELVSNALKHAFPHGREGTISIRCGDEGDHITLVVRDNGIGIPPAFDWKHTSSLGMHLVTSLIDQVEGTITLDRENGTTFTITVKRNPVSGGTG